MKFKRDRKIRNKAELTRLQRQFESAAKEIEKLENSKTTTASAAAYIIGIVGTAFIGWIIPYFCHVRIRRKKTAQVSPLIDQQYDVIYEVCEKANVLLTV